MNRFFVFLSLVAVLVVACPPGYDDACSACSGTLSPTTCSCSCGWTRVETVLYSMIFLPLAAVTLVYF